MPYWQLYYHLIWATKGRVPLILDSFAAQLHRRIAEKASQLGATVHAVGGIEDHVHLVVSLPPTGAISEFIRQVKGSSSYFINHSYDLPEIFNWQPHYGAISLARKQLDNVVEYAKKQREHHTQRTTIALLERISKNSDQT